MIAPMWGHMRFSKSFLSCAVIGATLSAQAVAGPVPTRPDPVTTSLARPETSPLAGHRLRPGRLLVKPVDKAVVLDDAARVAFTKALGRELGVELQAVRPLALGWLMVRAPSLEGPDVDDEATAALARQAKQSSSIAGATPDLVKQAKRLPDDPLVDFMWAIDAMGLAAAWDITIGGSAGRVGVVDTGLIAHEDLDDNTLGAIDFIADPDIGADGDGRDSNGTDVCPEDGLHGTHVAGTIAARGDNGVGITGVNWRAQLLGVRALGCPGGTGLTSDINEGALWLAGVDVPDVDPLAAADRARVINLSLGGEPGVACDDFSADVFAAIDRAGAIAVVAAGNESSQVSSPANCGGVIAVAASGPTDRLAGYTNFGPEIDIVAPGGDMDLAGELTDGIVSAASASLSDFDSGIPYGFKQGSSMATPNVAGVVSLMVQLDPGLRRADVEAILRQTGGSCGDCGGKPLLDAAAALRLIDSGGAIDDGGCDNTCQFADDGECDDGRTGAISAVCDPGTDCNDCDGGGGGGGGGDPACTDANNACQFADDGECDESDGTGACEDGTDAADCGRCVEGGGGGGGATCDVDNNGCAYANDGECDESDGTGACDDGTDAGDCGRCDGGNLGAQSAGVCGQQGLPLGSGLMLALMGLRRRRRRAA